MSTSLSDENHNTKIAEGAEEIIPQVGWFDFNLADPGSIS